MRFQSTALLFAIVATGCSGTSVRSTRAEVQSAPATVQATADNAKKRPLEIALEIAKRHLEQAKMAMEVDIAAKEKELAFAEKDLAMAKEKLETFKTLELPNKLAQAELDVQRMSDAAQENADELSQIEAMYEGQKLDDRTKEFVVSRGRRNAERAAKQLEIAKKNMEVTTKHDLPREQAKLELDVARKEADLQKSRAALQNDRIDREVRVLSAESEVAKAETDLAAAAAGVKS